MPADAGGLITARLSMMPRWSAFPRRRGTSTSSIMDLIAVGLTTDRSKFGVIN